MQVEIYDFSSNGYTISVELTAIAFCINELLSILENTSLMGIPYVRPDRTFLIVE